MKTTFNKLVGESRESLEIIDSHTLKTMIENKEDMTIIDVNDKEETDKRGMIQGAFNVSLGTLYYKADQEVPEDFKDNRIQDRDKKVVVTCGLGLCAAIGGKLLAIVIPNERTPKGPTSGTDPISILPSMFGLYFPEKIPCVPTEIIKFSIPVT